MKFRKKPVVIEAHQWFRNGDHPLDKVGESDVDASGYPYERKEGKIVRYFRHPEINGDLLHCELENTKRPNCTYLMDNHGWIETMEGGHTVCPSDFIITGIQGEVYPCEVGIFFDSYEPVGENESP